MLLERDLIQSVGFRNVSEDGRVTGFQFRVRMPSYRGMAASLIDGIAVRVGGLVDVGPDCPALDLRAAHLHAAAALGERRRALAPGGSRDRHRPLGRRPARKASTRLPSSCGCGCPTFRWNTSPPCTAQPEGDAGAGRRRRAPSATASRYTASWATTERSWTSRRRSPPSRTWVPPVSRSSARGTSRTIPSPRPAWIDNWFGLLEKYSLEPTNYGSWIDTRMHPGRTMTVTEGAEALCRDLRLAHRLGFGFVRPKIGVVSSDLVPRPDLDRIRGTEPRPGARAGYHHLPRNPLTDAYQASGG